MYRRNLGPRSCCLGCGCALLVGILAVTVTVVILGPTLGPVINTVIQGGPYRIAHRPLPSDSQQDTLLPPTVGSFQRGDVTAASNTFTTTYSDGSNAVQAVASAYSSASQAQDAVQTIKSKASGFTFNLTGLDPSYVSDSATQGQATWLAYSRGQYFFAFTGSSPSALDVFMTKYNY